MGQLLREGTEALSRGRKAQVRRDLPQEDAGDPAYRHSLPGAGGRKDLPARAGGRQGAHQFGPAGHQVHDPGLGRGRGGTHPPEAQGQARGRIQLGRLLQVDRKGRARQLRGDPGRGEPLQPGGPVPGNGVEIG